MDTLMLPHVKGLHNILLSFIITNMNECGYDHYTKDSNI